jgi:GntR family transcriptional regulator/MocR family aminotransferase
MTRVSASFLPPVALDRRSGVPMHRQLSEWFRHAIIGGQLRPGQRVPSTRALARELKISRLPVLSAYEQLFAEGYLETFTGAGTCVAQSIPGGTDLSPHPSANAPVDSSAPRAVSRLAALLEEPPPPWLANQGAFRVGVPALDHFPRDIWSKLVNRHARRMPTELMTYGDPIGYLPFREAIAQYLGTVRGVRCDASQILVTTGSQQGLLIATLALIEPKARVWMEEPGYPGAHQALQSVGAQIVPVPVDNEGLDVAEGIRRSRNARAAYISPSHQFPLGVTMSATRRIQLLNWAARQGAWIIEDDYDSEYRLAGHPVASLQGLDTDARVIYIGTFSKVVFPALRLGYVVVPKDVMPAFLNVRNAVDTFSSTLYQLVMTDFIREGHFARHIRRMRALYMERRTALLDAIGTHMGGRLDVIGAEAGMQLVALLPPGTDDVAISRAAAQQGVSIRPLSMCYLDQPGRSGLIFGYGGANVREIGESVRKLKSCF